MKVETMYKELKDLADKLGIRLMEQNLRKTGVPVISGLCKVKDQYVFVMDKHLSVRDKASILGECLARMPLENVYIVPAVRDFINRLSNN